MAVLVVVLLINFTQQVRPYQVRVKLAASDFQTLHHTMQVAVAVDSALQVEQVAAVDLVQAVMVLVLTHHGDQLLLQVKT
jgi:hypothetical protein